MPRISGILAGGLFPRLVALFPLLFPLYLLRGTFLEIPVTLPELVLCILFVIFLFRHKEWRLREWKLWPVWLFLLAGILGFLVVPSEAFMVDGSEFPSKIKALGIFKGWILAPLLYFIMARSVFREKPSMILWSLRALLVSGILLSAAALQQVISGEYLTPDMRASGPFESANYLALYLGPIVVYAGTAFLESRNKADQFLLGSGFFLGVLALYFTKSYAAFIAVMAGFSLALLLWVRKKGSRPFWTSFSLIMLFGIALLYSQLGTEKFTQFLDFADRSSSSVRIQIYEISTHLLLESPVFGIGLGQFEQQYQAVAIEVLESAPFEWNMLHPHNVFLAFWLNMGILGLVAFIWMSGRAFLWITERDSKERHIAALMLFVMIVHGLFDTPYFKNDLAFQFWLLMAILL